MDEGAPKRRLEKYSITESGVVSAEGDSLTQKNILKVVRNFKRPGESKPPFFSFEEVKYENRGLPVPFGFTSSGLSNRTKQEEVKIVTPLPVNPWHTFFLRGNDLISFALLFWGIRVKLAQRKRRRSR